MMYFAAASHMFQNDVLLEVLQSGCDTTFRATLSVVKFAFSSVSVVPCAHHPRARCAVMRG